MREVKYCYFSYFTDKETKHMKCKNLSNFTQPTGGTGFQTHVLGLRTEGLTAKLEKKKKSGKVQSIH